MALQLDWIATFFLACTVTYGTGPIHCPSEPSNHLGIKLVKKSCSCFFSTWVQSKDAGAAFGHYPGPCSRRQRAIRSLNGLSRPWCRIIELFITIVNQHEKVTAQKHRCVWGIKWLQRKFVKEYISSCKKKPDATVYFCGVGWGDFTGGLH